MNAWLALVLSLCAASLDLGCGPRAALSGPDPTSAPPTPRASSPDPGCAEVSGGRDRPFVVAWEATELANLENTARHGTLFVKYEGCSLVLLDACGEPSAAGRFGAYAPPRPTKGALQSFELKREGDLSPALPLGATTLSGHGRATESLRLTYLVSAVAQNTREAIYSGEIESTPGCRGATHFVASYELGAFELAASASSTEQVEGPIGGGAEVGRKSSRGQRSVTRGGLLSACEAPDPHACRVPIRLTLRSVSAGARPH